MLSNRIEKLLLQIIRIIEKDVRRHKGKRCVIVPRDALKLTRYTGALMDMKKMVDKADQEALKGIRGKSTRELKALAKQAIAEDEPVNG